jgi:hypothetical protein
VSELDPDEDRKPLGYALQLHKSCITRDPVLVHNYAAGDGKMFAGTRQVSISVDDPRALGARVRAEAEVAGELTKRVAGRFPVRVP